MDYKFLDKVLDQIVRETTIDMDEGRIYPPTSLHSLTSSLTLDFSVFISPPFSFTIHCRDVYGLNEQEIKYVWKEYKDIIKDKIENNG